MPGSLPPLQQVDDPAVDQNFRALSLAWPVDPTFSGSGSPEGAVTGGPGALYRDYASGDVWVHVSSSVSNTGWTRVNVLSITRGTGTITTSTASAVSASIAHGLGVTPTSIVCTARRTADTRDDYLIVDVSRDATNFVAGLRVTAFEHFGIGADTVVTFDWVAVA